MDLFRVNSKDTRTTSMVFLCYCYGRLLMCSLLLGKFVQKLKITHFFLKKKNKNNNTFFYILRNQPSVALNQSSKIFKMNCSRYIYETLMYTCCFFNQYRPPLPGSKKKLESSPATKRISSGSRKEKFSKFLLGLILFQDDPFYVIDFFLYSLKTLEILWFTDVFKGSRNRPVE